MKPRKTRVANHRLALLPIAVTVGVLALVTWAAISLAQPPMPHAGPPAPAEPAEFPDCLFCHQSGVAGSPRVVSDHVAYANDDCLTCHKFLMHPDAAFSHSDLLVGRHTELWCEDCHERVQRPGSLCADCHEPIPVPHFGTECENCHTPEGFGAADAGDFEHPLALEGAHATLACSDCHVAGQELVPDCAECHQPSSEPHYGAACQDCHTPEGFTVADLDAFEHPVALEGAHAGLTCSSCHVTGRELTYDCAQCHQPPSQPHFGDVCQDCHSPEGFEDVAAGGVEHPVALEGAHAGVACSNCHTGDQPLTYECSECHEPPSEPHLGPACGDCHSPEGWPESAESIVTLAPEIPHELEGRDDCLLCHDPEGQVKPAPSSHAERDNDQCALCHKAAP